MNRCKTAALAGMFLVATGTASASEYADFLRDLAKPYDHYRQSLVLTSSKDNAEKAQQAIGQFTSGWETLAARYADDPPRPFGGIADFSARIKRPVEVGRQAQALMKEGKVARAHSVLEEVRYLLWDMRIRSGINSIADKSNDFHEAMETVLDQAAAAKSPEELVGVEERYGAWLKIKWEEQALAGDLGPLRKEFEPAFADGRRAVADYLDALRAGNAEAAKKLSGGVKGAYKKVWSLDPR